MMMIAVLNNNCNKWPTIIMNMIAYKNFFCILSLLTALIIKKLKRDIFWLEFTLPF